MRVSLFNNAIVVILNRLMQILRKCSSGKRKKSLKIHANKSEVILVVHVDLFKIEWCNSNTFLRPAIKGRRAIFKAKISRSQLAKAVILWIYLYNILAKF